KGNKIEFQTVNNINIQHKIKPQIRLYSTKKKKKLSKNHISKPSINETNAIVISLENKNKEITVIHSDFDHNYNG
ncbi:Uncharacterized protein FWK35_00013998, partial [Aphis craccivora]